jgi:hypothetical protein
LDKRYELERTDVFVASYTRTQNEQSGEIGSHCVWSAVVDSLLPKTDRIYFFWPYAPENEKVAGYGSWDAVRNVVGGFDGATGDLSGKMAREKISGWSDAASVEVTRM